MEKGDFRKITESTLVPISLVVSIVMASAYVVSLNDKVAVADARISAIEESRKVGMKEYMDIVRDLRERLIRIEDKIGQTNHVR